MVNVITEWMEGSEQIGKSAEREVNQQMLDIKNEQK